MAKGDYLRAPIRWYGGKGNMISKLLLMVPEGGKPYCEPFCGGASLFFARKPATSEVLNDLDNKLITLMRCLQSPDTFAELKHRIQYTLYSRAELMRALDILQNENEESIVMQAWAKFVAHNFSVSGNPRTIGNWSRSFESKNGISSSNNSWVMRLTMLDDWHKRLLCAQIDNRDAIEVIKYWDNKDAVFYCDPPYVLDTRVNNHQNVYHTEMVNEMHQNLVETLLDCKGAVVLSGYYHEIYKPLEQAGWRLVKFQTACHAACKNRYSDLHGKDSALINVPRIECVWQNLRAIEMIMSKYNQQIKDQIEGQNDSEVADQTLV